MAKASKFYVVWSGHEPGIYTSWAEAEAQIKGFPNARFKAFSTIQEAEEALHHEPSDYLGSGSHAPQTSPSAELSRPTPLPAAALPNAIAVDAACSGNPGQMEYRGVCLTTGKVLFHFGPIFGTNNIGEFLAIVHALAWMKQQGLQRPIYSDSQNAIQWVRRKQCRTRLTISPQTQHVYELIRRAEHWLQNNTYSTTIHKWDTTNWGEIPADFGRK